VLELAPLVVLDAVDPEDDEDAVMPPAVVPVVSPPLLELDEEVLAADVLPVLEVELDAVAELDEEEPVLPRLEPPDDDAPELLAPALDALPEDPELAPEAEPSVGAGQRFGSKPGDTQTFARHASSSPLQSASSWQA